MNDSSASPMAGMVLDHRYRILRSIKAGGMGTVYEGEQLRLGKRVAIKVLRPEATYNDAARRRFEREAKLASRIRHRNVVELLDFGVQDDTAYYVMELLEGRDLASLLREHGRLSWDAARPILLQIARGLGAAHRLGIVHRDVKPGNCFLVAPAEDDEDEHEVVKVLDFGIAKLDPAHATDGGVTRTSELVGTVAYMSPEQAQSQPVDARSDVYSLGVLAYQLLTGTRPFHDDNVFNLLLMHVQEPPPPPRTIEPSIPEPVEEAILQALEKDPAARFPSMDAFRAALSSVPASVVGSATTIFVPDVDGAATVPVRRGASREEARQAAEAPEAEDAAMAATEVLDSPSGPLRGGTEEQPILSRPGDPLRGGTEEQPILARAGGTAIAPNPSGSAADVRSGHTAIAAADGLGGRSPSLATPVTSPEPISHPTPAMTGLRPAVSPQPSSLDRRLVIFMIAGALSLMIGVGLGVWLVQDEDEPDTAAPASATATTPVAKPPSEPPEGIELAEPTMVPDVGASLVGETGSEVEASSEAAGSGEETTGGDTGELAPTEPSPPTGRRRPKAKTTDAKVKTQLSRRAKKRCAGEGPQGTVVRMSLSIDPQGAITLVRLEPPHHRGPLGKCVRTAVSSGRFPGTGERRVLSLGVQI